MSSASGSVKFSEEMRRTLLTFHKKGMDGWGKRKQPLINTAAQVTSLQKGQIEVLNVAIV